MFRQNCDGSILWSQPAKLKLIELLKQNRNALMQTKCSEKTVAWDRVYAGLIRAGMPDSTIERVTKTWRRVIKTAKLHHKEQLKQYKRSGKLTPISDVDNAAIKLLNAFNSNPDQLANGIQVKEEPEDYMEDTNMLNETQSTQNRNVMDPVVLLERIDGNIPVRETPANVANRSSVNHSVSNSSSAEYWTLMQQVAAEELKVKTAQRKYEEQRLKFESEIHEKNLKIFNLKERLLQMEINAMQRPNTL